MADLRTVFQLVLISSQIESLYTGANRGCRVLLDALCRVVILLGYVLRSLSGIMDSSLSVELIDDDFVFDVLKETVNTMDTIET